MRSIDRPIGGQSDAANATKPKPQNRNAKLLDNFLSAYSLQPFSF